MSEEIRKRIEEKTKTISSHFVAIAYEQGAEFGYQLGYEQAMKELTRQAIDANSVKPIFDRAMTSESKEPSQDELWEEIFRVDEEEGTPEAKKRYRITRITS